MRRRELERSWAVTRKHLDAAREVLSVAGLDGTIEARKLISEYNEFLAHNELELALDMLEAAADGQSAPQEFWQHLIRAARNMGLETRAQQLAQEIR